MKKCKITLNCKAVSVESHWWWADIGLALICKFIIKLKIVYLYFTFKTCNKVKGIQNLILII